MECDIDAYIPATYIKNEYQKLDIYKRISAIETEDEYMDMQDELLDRFGYTKKCGKSSGHRQSPCAGP